MKRFLIDQVKNIKGWKTKRKLVIFSVDDYGNVRLDSNEARKHMDKAGLKIHSRFDAFDSLETREDLEALYDVLTSVKDKNGMHAVFTPFAIPCNINYELMAEEDYLQYRYENLPQTYEKLSQLQPHAYAGAWDLWLEGIKKGIMVPQFHGREHLNLKVFREKLAARDYETLTAMKNRSYTSISNSGSENISYTAAFEFDEFEENEEFKKIICEGLNTFESIFGYKSVHFNPPGGREHPVIHNFLKQQGVKYLDTPWIKLEHQGNGQYKRFLNWTGKKNAIAMTYQVRNVVFEPTHGLGIDSINNAMKQIEIAFQWNRPAIISSHRVNFCGHIDPSNRNKGLDSLRFLLKAITTKWPDVEFISSVKLGDMISAHSN